ncbi:hypothetical protein Tco_1493693 [Tanacetum coccineum]
MDLETAQITTTAKLPTLKEENGNSFNPAAKTTTNADGTSTKLIPGPVSTEEKVQKKNDMKARSMLLMALPNEHLMTFNQYKDAKTLFAVIQIIFGGNEAIKKTQKTLLKQMYENFSSPSIESLDSIFNRIQKIVSQLAILGEHISQEDLHLKFLRSLPSEWITHVVVWRNKPDLDTMSFDDIYNNFKIVEQEDLKQIHKDDIEEMDLKWQLALLSMRTRRNQDSSRRTVNVEEISSKAMLAIDGAGFDWSYMADDEVPINMAFMAFSDSEIHNDKTCSKTYLKSFETLKTQLDDLKIEFNKFEFNLANYKRGLASVEEQLVFYKKNEPEFEGYGPKTSKSISKDISNEVMESPDAPLVKELVSDDKLEKKIVFPTVAKIYFVRAKQQEKRVRKPVMYAKMYSKACFVCGSFDHVQANCSYHQRERVVSGNNYTRMNYNYSTKQAHPSAHRNMAARAVLMKTGLRPLKTIRPVNTAHSKTIVYSAKPMPKAVNTAKLNLAVVNAVRENQCHLQKEDQVYVDSGCSWHMTCNMSYLSDFKEFDRGYVTFRGGHHETKGIDGSLYALTENPTIYVSLIQQFWNTATGRTLDNGEMEITATIDGKNTSLKPILSESSIHILPLEVDIGNIKLTVKIVSKESIRRHLKLKDSDGISNLPTTESFEQLALIGSPTQTNVADKAASTGVDVRHGGATTTVTSLDAGHGSGNIDKTSIMPHDSPLPRVYTLESDNGNMKHNELMLIKKVKKLEKTVKIRQARRKAKIFVSDDEEDLEDPSKQERKIVEIDQDPDISLVQHDVEVQGRHEHDMESDFEFTTAEEIYTVEKEVSTAEPVSTAGVSVSTVGASSAKDKGKAIMEEAETIQTKTKLQLEQERLGYEEALRL